MALARVCLASASLPSGYTQLAFLESSGTQYIDTGVVFGKTNGFSITYQVVAPDSSGNQVICGSRNDDGNTRCILGSNSPYYHTYMTNGTTVATNTFRQSLAYVGWNDLKFSMNYGILINDGTKGVADVNFCNSGTYDCRRAKSGSLGELTGQTASFYLFAGKMVAPTETMYYGHCRIWEARISAGADVIRHFVAARRKRRNRSSCRKTGSIVCGSSTRAARRGVRDIRLRRRWTARRWGRSRP